MSLTPKCPLLSIAPMIDWSNMPFRVLMRLLAPHALLYTEMHTPDALFYAPHRSLLKDPIETPVALQLGGNHPTLLKDAAKLVEASLFSEVNLNIGCPSPRVQSGRFGACLMREPQLVSEIVAVMKASLTIPVTVKTRIGVDELEDYDYFENFIRNLVKSGVDKVIVHARKAWLKGLNPKENRTIPPLKYEWVYALKRTFPELPIVLNGGITSFSAITTHLTQLDGVMLGRLALENPYEIARIHHALYPNTALPKRDDIFLAYHPYLLRWFESGLPLSILLKPLFRLAWGLPNAKRYKQILMTVLRSKNLCDLDHALSCLHGT